MKTLEAYLVARNYAGGTIHQATRDLRTSKDINMTTCVYGYGLREGVAKRHGNDIANYPIPVNSWDNDSEYTLSYLKGLLDGLEWEQ